MKNSNMTFTVAVALTAFFMTPMASAESATGEWDVWRDTDVMDDSVIIFAYLVDATSGATLNVGCRRNQTDVYIRWGDESYFGGKRNHIEVQTRVDSEPMESDRWTISTDRSSTFFRSRESDLPDELASLDFVDRILNASRLIARVTPPSASPVTATFELEGVRWALMPIADFCGWLWLYAVDLSVDGEIFTTEDPDIPPSWVNDFSVALSFIILDQFAKGKGETPEMEKARPLIAESFEMFFQNMENATDDE